MLVSDLSPWFIRVFAFVFGAVWGSFFNVAIHRWPRDMSVVSPPSHCPACGEPIKAGRNIPLVSWLLLRGKAACCGARVSPRYFLVELISACLGLAVAEHILVADPGAELLPTLLVAVVWFAFVGALLVAAFADLETGYIPDEVSLGGTALGLVTVGVRGFPEAEAAAFGAGIGFLIVQLPFVWAYERLAGRRGMGEGDAKLLMMIGAFLGWHGVLFALAAGAAQGLVAAALIGVRDALRKDDGKATPADGAGDAKEPGDGGEAKDAKPDPGADGDRDDDAAGAGDEEEDEDDEPPPDYWGHRKVRFGPFLSLGALEFLFFGDTVLEWYAGLF